MSAEPADPVPTTPLFAKPAETLQESLGNAIAPVRSRLGWLVLFALMNVLASMGWLRTALVHEQWEYRTDYLRDVDGSLSAHMTSLGEEGWEAYSSRRASDGDDANGHPQMGTEVMYRRHRR